jgi:hypothetical protein
MKTEHMNTQVFGANNTAFHWFSSPFIDSPHARHARRLVRMNMALDPGNPERFSRRPLDTYGIHTIHGLVRAT